MERNEKLHFQQDIENYFEEKRVYNLFEKLLKELIILKPSDPLDYMIKRLQTPDTKRIFITGSAGVNRKEISLSLANHFGYEGISVGDILRKEVSKKLEIGKKIEPYIKSSRLVPDEIIIDLLKQELVRLEKSNQSYIVEGFPRNRVQAMFLKSVGILPDNVILMTTDDVRIKSRLSEKIPISQEKPLQHPKQVNDSFDEYDLNIKGCKEVFPNHFSVNVDDTKQMSTIIDDLSRVLKLKNKSLSSRKPPRVILLGPPCSKKSEIANAIAQKYSIVHVSLSSLLNAEIRKSNDNSKSILSQMDRGDLVDNKYVLKLLEERLFASDAMINGWILTGFPKNSAQLKFIETEYSKSFKPSLILNIELDDEIVLKRSSMRRVDPLTGLCVYLDSKNFDPNSDVARRLIIKNEDKEDVISKRLENWKKFSYNELSQIQGEIRLDGKKDVSVLVDEISHHMQC